jgi:hypothetical protein
MSEPTVKQTEWGVSVSYRDQEVADAFEDFLTEVVECPFTIAFLDEATIFYFDLSTTELRVRELLGAFSSCLKQETE